MEGGFKNDVSASLAYLDGFIQFDDRNIPRHKSYKEGSKDSDFCRQSLARVLRSEHPLPTQLREMLADMFDTAPRFWKSRKLIVSNRKAHRQKDVIAVSHMAQFVYERIIDGANTEAAIRDATVKFQVSREYMFEIWGKLRPVFEAMGGLPSKNGQRIK